MVFFIIVEVISVNVPKNNRKIEKWNVLKCTTALDVTITMYTVVEKREDMSYR